MFDFFNRRDLHHQIKLLERDKVALELAYQDLQHRYGQTQSDLKKAQETLYAITELARSQPRSSHGIF